MLWLDLGSVLPRKSQNTTNLFLRRIFRRSTNSYTLHKFEDKKPVQRYRSIIHQFVHSNWHLDASDVFADCSAIATRELAVLLNQLRLPSLHSWPANCIREATGEAGSPFSRVERRGKRRSPAEWAICHCPLGSSSELILRAASSATGRALPSNVITGRAPSTRPTRRRSRRRTGPRSVRQPTSGKPKCRCPRMSSPS